MNYRIFDEYKEISIKIIDKLKKEEVCMELMNARSNIIEVIISGGYNKKELRSLYNSLGIEEIDKRIEKIIKNELNKTKIAIDRSVKGRQAVNGYNSAIKNKNFYSVKI